MESSNTDGPEPRTVGRREFLKRATVILTVPIAVALGWPLVASLIGPIYRKGKPYFSRVPGFGSAPVGQPVRLHLPYSQKDMYLRESVVEDVWVIKHSPTSATVFSPICPHLGCRFDWDPERREFVCPCHQSVFSLDGAVVGGPAPRALDPLPHRIEGGTLWVEWERFEPGLPTRVRVG
jgi:menaquinol-cytochrome c reductase iron-sulfur subunit